MKRFIFIGFLISLSGIVLCQTPLDKTQQKKVSEINKQVQKQHNDILKNSALAVDEKKSRVEATKSERDAELAKVLTPDQVNAVKAKDPINWTKVMDQIDKQERSRLKGERDQKLKEVDQQIRTVNGQQDDVKKQIKDLQRKQKDLNDQQSALKKKKKEINAYYK